VVCVRRSTGLTAWPSKGLILENAANVSTLLVNDSFDRHELGDPWQLAAFPGGPDSTCALESALKLTARAHCSLFVERPLPSVVYVVRCAVSLGSDQGTTWGPGMAILWPNRVLRVNVRADGRFGVDDGCSSVYGGMILRGDWNHLAIHIGAQDVCVASSVDGHSWSNLRSYPRHDFPGSPLALRLGKMGRHGRLDSHRECGPVGSSQFRCLRVFGHPQASDWFIAHPEPHRLKGPHWHRPQSWHEPTAIEPDGFDIG
jgi:hypothetical protein